MNFGETGSCLSRSSCGKLVLSKVPWKFFSNLVILSRIPHSHPLDRQIRQLENLVERFLWVGGDLRAVLVAAHSGWSRNAVFLLSIGIW